MCGIAGYLGSAPPSDEAIDRTLECMRRRGPDHQGAARFALPNGTSIALLSSRLAIVDLDRRSNMPFQRDGWTIVFNGEIYNHRQLREELVREGLPFSTDSDTEVLVAGLARYGFAFLDRAEGMWAFAAFNQANQELILSRDRFGEKPLLTHTTAHGVYFASEPKAIATLSGKPLRPNENQIVRYLVNGYRSLHKGEESWHHAISVFPQGSVQVHTVDGSVARHRYWTLSTKKISIDKVQAVERLRDLLPAAIGLRLRADVPIACCLSGGVDSSTIASIAVKSLGCDLHTFSIVDPNPHYDERANIEAVVHDLGCRSDMIEVPQAPFLERLKDLISYHDGPLATISYYIHSFLSEAISKAGYRVALSGTGSDEIFTGYYDHYLMHMAEMAGTSLGASARDAWQEYVLPVIRNPHLREWDKFIRDPSFREHLYLRYPPLLSALREGVVDTERFAEHNFGCSLLRNRMLNELFFEVVPPILHEDDLNSMRWSVENRSPFLDRRLVEFCNSLPSDYLIENGYQKSLLREATSGIVVDTVRLNRKKIGFNASIGTLLDRTSADTREVLLRPNPLFEIVDPSIMKQLLDKAELTNQESQLLFSMVNASLFLAED